MFRQHSLAKLVIVMCDYNSGRLRLVWNLVEVHAPLLRSLNDEARVGWLLKTIKDRIHTTDEDERALQEYLLQRSCLIGDMVEPQCFSLPARA